MPAFFGIAQLQGPRLSGADLQPCVRLLGAQHGLRSEASPDGTVLLFQAPGAPAPRAPAILVADARLDNRAELHQRLRLQRPLADVSDADLILAAYQQLGTAAAEALLGDFAFAVWDEQRQTLFCARDRAGLKPFYFHRGEHGAFVFSTRLRPLLALPGFDPTIDRTRVADFLAGLVLDSAYTFYKNVERLRPAHWLTVSRDGLRQVPYWQLDPQREVHYATDAEYEEAFRSVFYSAVDCRLRGAERPAVTLSGGIDSSAVAAAAQGVLARQGRPPLITLTNVYDRLAECDERAYVQALTASLRCQAYFVPSEDAHFPLATLERFVRDAGEPVFAPGAGQSVALRQPLRDAADGVVLSGHGGDEVVSHAPSYLRELATAGHWRSLWREVRLIHLDDDDAHRTSLFIELLLGGMEQRLAAVRLMAPARRLSRGLRRRLARGRNRGPQQAPSPLDLVDPDLAREVDLPERLAEDQRQHRASLQSVRRHHHYTLTHPMQPLALETLHTIGETLGYEERIPFWDSRLVEFCLALPSNQKRRNGFDRWILRAALRDRLPPAIHLRRDKTRFDASIRHGLLHNEPERLAQLRAELPRLEGLVDAGAAAECLDDHHLEADGLSLHPAMRLAALVTWLSGRTEAPAT